VEKACTRGGYLSGPRRASRVWEGSRRALERASREAEIARS
jgi:hypothetical protein